MAETIAILGAWAPIKSAINYQSMNSNVYYFGQRPAHYAVKGPDATRARLQRAFPLFALLTFKES